ncbi:MAG: hypothetical protein ACFFD4_40210 [Candidatus Odinarchaeota archaeon]
MTNDCPLMICVNAIDWFGINYVREYQPFAEPFLAAFYSFSSILQPEQVTLYQGFEAIAVGYGLRYPDYAENIARQFEVYDSQYAWCRLNVAGVAP